MRIAFCSYTYPPAVGGTETAGRLLVEQFRKEGHNVTVLTEIPGEHQAGIFRRPSYKTIFRICRDANIIFINNISLRYAWAAFLARRPLVVTTHYYIEGSWWKRLLKKAVLRFADFNIAASPVFLSFLPPGSKFIPPPFDAEKFSSTESDSPRSTHVAFVGRLVSAKGVDVLLSALHILRTKEGIIASTIIIGDGPERMNLEKLVNDLQLQSQVVFTGTLSPIQIHERLVETKVLVVPSRVEPFGIVALEGIASGAYVLGSHTEGLPHAIGKCGETFPPGDPEALAQSLARILQNYPRIQIPPDARKDHLRQFTPETIGAQYLDVFRRFACHE